MNSQPDIAVFSVAVDSENKIIQILHGNGQKNKIGQNCQHQDRDLPLNVTTSPQINIQLSNLLFYALFCVEIDQTYKKLILI